MFEHRSEKKTKKRTYIHVDQQPSLDDGGATSVLQVGEKNSRNSHTTRISILQEIEVEDEFEMRSTHIFIRISHRLRQTNGTLNTV